MEKHQNYGAMNLQYKWNQKWNQKMGRQENRTLDNRVNIRGLMIADDPSPVFINLLIDTGSPSSHMSHTSADSKPNLKNLKFRGSDGTIVNVAEEIGDRFFDFGVQLLNDTSGS